MSEFHLSIATMDKGLLRDYPLRPYIVRKHHGRWGVTSASYVYEGAESLRHIAGKMLIKWASEPDTWPVYFICARNAPNPYWQFLQKPNRRDFYVNTKSPVNSAELVLPGSLPINQALMLFMGKILQLGEKSWQQLLFVEAFLPPYTSVTPRISVRRISNEVHEPQGHLLFTSPNSIGFIE